MVETETELEVIAPDRRRHMDGMTDLIAKVFSGPGYYACRDRCRKWYVGNSHYDWGASRIGLRDGRIVTHYGVWGYEMRIGSARVKVGGIGVVATDGDYRKQGLMAKTVPHSIAAMRELGYDFTILFGIRNFYHQFGYVRAWEEETWVLRPGDLPAEAPAVRPVKFQLRAREDLADLFNRENAGLTGTAIRPTYTGVHYPDRGEMVGYLWKDGRGRAVGYIVLQRDGGRLTCIDAVGDVDQALRVMGLLVRKWGITDVRFDSMHYEGRLCRRLRRMYCRYERRYFRNGGPMIRVINLRQVLERMSEVLGKRLAASELSGWRGRLLIGGAEESVVLEIDRSKVKVAEAGRSGRRGSNEKAGGNGSMRGMEGSIRAGDHVAQLLIGTDEPEELVEAAGMKLGGEARRLLPVLFPNQHPQLHMADRY